MDPFVKDRIEEYLTGDLPALELEQFEAKLAEDPEAMALLEEFSETASMFESIRVEPAEAQLPGDFYAHLQQTIDQEKEIPFWAVFTEPFILKRMAFGALMWMFALGSLTLMNDRSTQRSTELADMILRDQPAVQMFQARMVSDLEHNREAMLGVVLAANQD